MKRILLFALPFLFATQINAQQTKILTAEKHNEYGLVYTLPTTGFKIDIVAVKEVKKEGPFSKYAKLFTSDADVVTEESQSWTLESVTVTPYGVPDPEHRYLMQVKAGSPTFIGVAEDGMLLSINTEPVMNEPEPINIIETEGVASTGKEYLEYVNEDFISAPSSYKKAQLLSEEIMEIRDAKIALTRGTAETMPTDGRQLELMLASLETQEKALMSAFTGSSWKERVVRSFNFVPKKEGKYILCDLSQKDGIVGAKSGGEPIYVDISVIEKPRLPQDAKGEDKKIPKDAVIYNIPGTSSLTVTLGNNKLFQEVFPMSQFGMVFGLNPGIFTDKKEPSFAIFDQTTGGIKELGTLKP